MSSKGFTEEIVKQELDRKDANKKEIKKKIDDLVVERKSLEAKLLETNDSEQSRKIEASIASVKEDTEAARKAS